MDDCQLPNVNWLVGEVEAFDRMAIRGRLNQQSAFGNWE
jgi:hypothetical protein